MDKNKNPELETFTILNPDFSVKNQEIGKEKVHVEVEKEESESTDSQD
ncbi:hypothetical protein [Oceanobacillus senegalensis]|nr:hypothetical protein [Oceanobacillus senegalensis]